jgi:hypothetical protein
MCPVCFWEDDPIQLRWPTYTGGANKPSLVEAQRHFAATGAKQERVLGYVRPPTADEARDPGWQPVSGDNDFEPLDAVERDWPADLTVLYWWRPTFWRLSATAHEWVADNSDTSRPGEHPTSDERALIR